MNNTIEYPFTPWKAANRCIGDARGRIEALQKERITASASIRTVLRDRIDEEEERISYLKGFMEGLKRKDGLDIEAYHNQALTLFGRRQRFALGVLDGASGKW
jgi:hypothetical protein